MDREPSVEEQIKTVGLKAGALVVGIASADAFNDYVPAGHRPEDFLPGAKSVVVAGGKGPTAGAWRSPNNEVMESTGYDFRENVAVHVMADFIERELGYYAIQAPSLSTRGHQPPMSMMLSAVLAGLGTRSLAANIILNPDYGMLYYAALLTTLPLTPDHPLEKEACPAPSCVKMFEKLGTTPCMRACPASEGGCLDGTIEHGRITHSFYNRERCHTRAQNYGMGGFQKALLEIVNEDDPERRKTMIYSDFFTRSITALAFYKESVAQCFECIRVCPIGKVHRINKK
jgi:epoxyqueuosine reductase QueG